MTDYSEIDIKWEWLPAEEVKAPELRATWTRLEIHVGTQCVTLVEDVESESSRRSIFVPLYPLAEWIAYHWWHLVADYRPATLLSRLWSRSDLFFEPATKTHRQRHGFRSAGDGFLWPNLLVIPQGRSTRLIWRADDERDPLHPVRFIKSGEATIDHALLEHQLAHLVDSVIVRLQENGIRGTELEREWAAVQGVDADEREYCLAAARLGLDPYREADEFEEKILAAREALHDDDFFGDFVDAVEPADLASTLDWVREARGEIEQLTSGGRDLSELKSDLRGKGTQWRGSQPWEQGWEQARLVRNALTLNSDARFEVGELLQTVVRRAPSGALQAIGGSPGGADGHLVVLGRAQNVTTTRFTLGRALWHVVWQNARDYLITSSRTDRQKTERAFAAELLAPASGIAQIVGEDPFAGLEDGVVEEIAVMYDVSPFVVRHQIDNQLLRVS